METTLDRHASKTEADPRDRGGRLAAGAAVVVIGLAICALRAGSLYWLWYGPWLRLYSLLATAFILTRLAIAAAYRPPADRGHLPTLSIVISAMNEEGLIAKTIGHCFRSRYPADRFEVIAIDDGSTDGTWRAMQEAHAEFPRLKLIRFEENRGKREGMTAGVLEAKGELIVFVDSDTLLEPDGLYNLAQPFVDPAVGAVSGHILIDIDPSNFISKMESVRYYVSHRLLKASESVFGAVTCCPGPFSAYRREAVLNILERWRQQRFLGVRATFGDDRSLTNFILRDYKILFHDGARCATAAPESWKKFFRQQARWKKSWMRETMRACCFMWREHPVAAISYYVGVLLTVVGPLTVLRALLYSPMTAASVPAYYLVGLALGYLFLSLICLYFTRSRYWYFGLAFAWLYIFVLSWQNYYAMFTLNRTAWGTR